MVPVGLAPRRRRLALAVLALVGALVLSACTEEQLEVIDRVNVTRAEHGLEPVTPHPVAIAKAQAWAEHLAGVGELSHSVLSEGMSEGWQKIGENVGYSGDIATVHEAFLDSPGHRANILDPEFNWMGSGYAESDDGRIWVVQVFARY